MNSDRRVDPIVLLGEFDGAVECVRPRSVAIADREQDPDTRLVGARDDFGAVGVEALAIEMSVGVGVHQKRYSLFANRFSLAIGAVQSRSQGRRDKVAVVAKSEERTAATSTLPPPVRPPRIPPVPAGHRRRQMRPQSFRSIPARAACVAADWPRSRPSAL